MTTPTLSPRREAELASSPARRYELDWLRVLIIVGLIPFHVIMLFVVAAQSYLSGKSPNSAAEIATSFFILWPISLLFLVAGASTWFALARRTPGQYMSERLLRLFFPFVFVTLTLIPLQVYAIVHAYPQLLNMQVVPPTGMHAQESFAEFYPQYLAGYGYFLRHFSSAREAVFWGHLWFVPRLLLYALATLPVLLWLRSKSGMRAIARLATMFALPGTTLLLGLMIALPRLGGAALYHLDLRLYGYVNWDYYSLGSQLVVFLACFLLGYVIYASPPLLRALYRDGPVALALGILVFAVLQTPVGHFASVTQVTPGGILITCLRAEGEWLLIAGALSLALRFFTVSNSLLHYLSEAAYPLYVLHMPVLILVGVTVVQWHLPIAITLPLVVIATLALTLGFYEFVIKRIMPLRLLFGLRARPVKAAARGEAHNATQAPQ